MKMVRWTRFTWDLDKLPPREHPLADRYVIRASAREEQAAVAEIIVRALSLDSDWADHYRMFRARMDAEVRLAFERESLPALVILHGVRIVATSVLNTDPAAESHLVSGPCVLAEYRNRGLGAALLHESLVQLAFAGLQEASGISKENVPATRFIYPQFGSTQADCRYDPAASPQG